MAAVRAPVTQRADAKGQMTQYSYDAYERVVQTRHYACTGTCSGDFSQVNYTYDTPSYFTGISTVNTMGRLSTVAFTGHNTNSANNYAYQYSYNTAGRVIEQALALEDAHGNYTWATANYAWDAYGRLTQTTTPGGTVLNYQYDAMSRLTSISETQPGSQAFTAASASYNSASLITSLTYGASGSQFAETRTYNNLLQMTRATVTASAGTLMDMQYIFPSGSNNGKVSQTIDGVLGETVAYQYDSLNRLIAATASNNSWGEAYGFDGFGNLQSKTPTVGSAPTGGGATPATNQPIGVTLDANGNTLGTGATYTWDVENRLMATPVSGQTAYYDYDPWGKRIFKDTPNVAGQSRTCELYFYGLGGQKLETFTGTYAAYAATGAPPYFTSNGTPGQIPGSASEGINLNFGIGGKMLQSKGVWVATDRLGSVRANSNGEQMSYFPYGEERTNTANGREKFGTYTRDGIGQDYADQRYYNSGSGAFWSPDPGGMGTADPKAPISWNGYGFAMNDPGSYRRASVLRPYQGIAPQSNGNEPGVVPQQTSLVPATAIAAPSPASVNTNDSVPDSAGQSLTLTTPLTPSPGAVADGQSSADAAPQAIGGQAGLAPSGDLSGDPTTTLDQGSASSSSSNDGGLGFAPDAVSKHCGSLGAVSESCQQFNCDTMAGASMAIGTIIGGTIGGPIGIWGASWYLYCKLVGAK